MYNIIYWVSIIAAIWSSLLIINIHFYRVYGCKYGYGKSNFECPNEYPIEVKDYPNEGKQTNIYLGKIPNEIRNVLIANFALAKNNPLLPSSTPRLKGDDIISLAINQNKSNNITPSKKWIVTLETVFTTTVDEEKINRNSKHFWMDVHISGKLNNENKNFISEKFDELIAYITPEVGEEYIDELIAEDYFITSHDKSLGFYTFPEPKISLEIHQQRPISSLNVSNIKENIKVLKNLNKGSLKFLKNVQHWYTSTLNEKDAWKVFLWSYWGIEVLSRKYASKYYQNLSENIVNNEVVPALVIGNLLTVKERLNIKASFSIMVAILLSDSVSKDIETFKRVSKMRNKISHGEAVREEDLPVEETRDLFYKYYNLAIKDQLKT